MDIGNIESVSSSALSNPNSIVIANHWRCPYRTKETYNPVANVIMNNAVEPACPAIEACRVQLSETTSECCSGQTSSDDGPVLEEFIPINKTRTSSDSCNDVVQHHHHDDIDEQHHIHSYNKPNIPKSDWLRSVQLWTNNNPQPPLPITQNVPMEAKGNNGGAFQPFQKDTATVAKPPSSTPPPPPPVAAASCTGGGSDKKEGQNQRKQKRSATPKQIRELMKVDGLTNDEVKSHLQKFRLHTRRPSPMIQNHNINNVNNNSQTAPFVIVGNFIMPPPELAAPPSGIYTPAAAPPHAVAPGKVKLRQIMEQHYCEHSNSEEKKRNVSEVADHSNSPTSSFSTHT
ncbi:transcription factor HHO3-like [Senna tora]|uniref:Transcription factor HHO3-like n=1 Tax=Senna tora TaxID=362788 RepID=A0A834SQU0_9FABA|nr:transcription factor HHO3-like [Senna tora]